MAFKPIHTPSRGPETPEALFRDLRTRTVEGLLSHQADVLREYVDQGLETADVALELPTGSGKTLVGLLIGEWRRVTRRERVVFLCPTRQLVHQVVEQGNTKFGLNLVAFTGPKADYDIRAKGDYQNAERMAVTTYSALFNINPFFDDAQVIILDDAHTSENYIASPWRLDLRRDAHTALFDALSAVVSPLLSETEAARLSGEWRDSFERTWADAVPTARLASVQDEIVELLDAGTEGTNLVFPWQFLRSNLRAAHLFVGTEQMSFRPWVPPTGTHGPFADARQRLYMSATLGQAGDLERITGRKRILHLATPAAYERHGVGRRLFLFPERSLDGDAAEAVVEDAVREAGRALFIVPSEQSAARLREKLSTALGCAAFDARDIEESKEAFLAEDRAVAVVANRYDGIDLPKDECRLLVIDSLPRARDLLERFIIERMGASALLTERTTNRIVQAVGRCTRADTDYAVVIPLGEELGARLLQPDQRRLFHPEMQAELEFGVQQSSEASAADFQSYIRWFLAQSDEWTAANEAILRLRDQAERTPIPGAADLAAAAPHEVQYQYSLWSEDWESALESAREVLTVLTHASLRGYRALWLYLAGNAAWLLADSGVATMADTARDYFRQAHRASSSVRWLRELARWTDAEADDRPPDDGTETLLIRMEGVLESLGTQNNRRFSREQLEIRQGLAVTDSSQFERAHVRLGRLLGYDADNVETPGAPDPWWIVDENRCLIFEDHSEADPTSSLSVTKARQVASHVAWAKEHLPLAEHAVVLPILVSPVSRVDRDAPPHLSGVYHWDLEDFRRWAGQALDVVRSVRTTFPGAGDIIWRGQAAAALRAAGLSPEQLVDRISAHPASALGIS